MWGNQTGWIISGVLALIMSGVLAMIALPPAPTAPTNAAALTIARGPIVLPVSPDTVVPAGKEECDAGVFYRKAIDDYQFNSENYERFKSDVKNFPIKKLTGLDYLLKARNCRNFTLFANHPSDVVNYENGEPGLEALDDIGTTCCTVGLLYTKETYNPKTRPEEARKLWEAAFILGKHLYEERTSWRELSVGLALMNTAAKNLGDYYHDIKPDPAAADAIQKFMDEEGGYQTKIIDAIKILTGIDENSVGQYAGDMFAIARRDGAYTTADSMFRTEAILHVGRYRFNSVSQGDQLAARKILTKMVDDPSLSPALKAAATAAHELTLAKFHAYG